MIQPFDGYEEHDYDEAFMQFVIDVESIQARALGDFMVKEFNPRSVIDLGCGPGLYLLPYKDAGADVLGVDASPYGGKLLYPSEYVRANLRFRQNFGPYDLAICFETLEHLRPDYTHVLLDSLTELSDLLLVSWATPGQGGTNHYSECPLDKQLAIFENYGFRLHQKQDAMRLMLSQFEHMRDKEVSGWIMDNSYLLERA